MAGVSPRMSWESARAVPGASRIPLRKWPVAIQVFDRDCASHASEVPRCTTRDREIGWADEREFVGGSGTKAGPAFEDFRIGDGGKEFGGGFEKGGDGVGRDGLVESGMLDGGTDSDAAGTSGDEVDFGCAENMVQVRAHAGGRWSFDL